MKGREGFPWVLTFCAALVAAICSALGVWQLQRAAWKSHVLAEIATRERAAPQPIGPVLARAARGEDIGFTRVTADCGSASGVGRFKAASEGTEWVWRAMDHCVLESAYWPSIDVDRGTLDPSRGSTTAPTTILPPLRQVTGVLLPRPGGDPVVDAPFVLIAERESPPPPGVRPEPFSATAPENLQYVGAYAPTWFGLAAVVLGVYAAMLWRRRRSP